MRRLLEIAALASIILAALAMGPPTGAPMAQARDDGRSERFDPDLSRHDRGELWEEDSHRSLRERYREREYGREPEREHKRDQGDHRDSNRNRDMGRDRERQHDRDEIRERFQDRDRDDD